VRAFASSRSSSSRWSRRDRRRRNWRECAGQGRKEIRASDLRRGRSIHGRSARNLLRSAQAS